MNYTEAIDYLKNLTKFGFNFGLGRIEELMRRLGDPHRHINIIHIGGTNGKGSTTAIAAAILQAAGYRTGTFTSPHLHAYNERYRINGEEISDEKIAAMIARLRPHLEQMAAEGFEHPTEFEVSTALAFLYFFEEKVDFLVLEVGLGGAIDSTNVAAPLVSVITNVAMDHMDYLGHAIEEIATVKAGIIKSGVPVVTAAGGPALEVIRQRARELGSGIFEVGRDTTFEILDSSVRGESFKLTTPRNYYPGLHISLIGAHQVVNAATAVTAVELLADRGFRITPESVTQGLLAVRWPARLEVVQEKPAVLLDGAHNYDGAVSLHRALTEIFKYRRLILVLGMLGDKEREKVVAKLAPLAGAVVVTKPNSPRAGEWQQVAAEAGKYAGEVYLEEDIHTAVKKAVALAGDEDLVCVTGSLYMVAEARELFI
ncbi:bifunctional folylpolyglutamate synthase/dihydrofolate synthase [bacterium]|nr:MAG: bifunctional folylpolyglutamate synthase/dihydrofolate synthase [bacterium]